MGWTWDGQPFNGAKAALICGADLVVLRRDDRPDIPYPGRIDLPGGGRDPGESPLQTVCREIREEVALEIAPARFVWGRAYAHPGEGQSWFLAARITQTEAGSLRLGDEGQACWMMATAQFLTHPEGIARLQQRLSDALPDLS